MQKRNKTLIISVCLCICLCLMVAYAAFATNLTINGTGAISSNWQVEITKVISQNIQGTAANDGEPIASPTAVTFKTLLKSPGDSIDYVVTIENKGTLPAKLESIKTTDMNNPAIIYTVNNLQEGEVLEPSASKEFTVTVAYNNEITSQPSLLNSSLTVALDFVQNK